jgi:hypothetical protein
MFFFSNERQLPPINRAINSPLGTPPLIEHRPCRPLGRRCFSPVPSFVLLRHPRVSTALALHCCSSALDLPQRCSSTSADYRADTHKAPARRDRSVDELTDDRWNYNSEACSFAAESESGVDWLILSSTGAHAINLTTTLFGKVGDASWDSSQMCTFFCILTASNSL